MLASLRSLARRSSLLIALVVWPGIVLPPTTALAQEEARLLFERGNGHLARGLRARGRGRERELASAIDAYLGVLRLGARTRNVVFNLALAHAELGRHDEAFNYYGEYLRVFDLSDEERAEGQRRLDTIRPRVAVARIESAPLGAEVRVGRRDLPVRGVTPLELALPAGTHSLLFSREGFADAGASVTVAVGAEAPVRVELEGRPVDVQFLAPGEGRLTLDGEPIEPGRAHPVAPGAHVVRLELPGAQPIERRFEVAAGDAPLVLELSGGGGAGARVSLNVEPAGEVRIDDLPVGQGERHELPLLPGLHELRVSAPGRRPLVHALRLESGQALRLAVELAPEPDATGVHAARAVFGALATLAAGVAAGLVFRAFEASDAWNAARLDPQREIGSAELGALADGVEAAALGADLGLSVAAGLGLGALISLLVEPGGGEESSVRILAGPAPGAGGVVGLAWRAP